MKLMCQIFCLILMLCLIATAGCNKTILIRQSLSPIPEEAKGVLYVATNKPIPVGIEGADVTLDLDVGGYYLIHKNDLQAMVKQIRDGKTK